MADNKETINEHMAGEWTEQELMAANVRNAKQALQVMEQLDKIKTPLEVTIYMAGNRSTYRNQAYRQMVSDMDTETKNALEQFIKSNNPREMNRLFPNTKKTKRK